jgi:putative tryptophan/tyrosine transport system substrate-binding protein
MRRRQFVITCGLLCAASASLAQGPPAARRIALLDDGDQTGRAHLWRAFTQRLEELGFTEGRNIAIERRWSGSAPERMSSAAEQIVREKPDVIVTSGTSVTRAVLERTSTIPVVFTNVGNPTGAGLVASLPRPGGNATGLSILGAETHAKRLELLGEVIPRGTRFGFLGPASNRSVVASLQELQRVARARKRTVLMLDAADGAGIERAFASLLGQRVEGVIVASMLLPHRRQVVELAARYRVPAIYVSNDFLEEGGLIAFGPDLALQYRRAADYVHRILRGARPADLPVEQPTMLALGINLRTAKALGIEIPPALLLRADRVIE